MCFSLPALYQNGTSRFWFRNSILAQSLRRGSHTKIYRLVAMAFGLSKRKAALLLFYGAPLVLFLLWTSQIWILLSTAFVFLYGSLALVVFVALAWYQPAQVTLPRLRKPTDDRGRPDVVSGHGMESMNISWYQAWVFGWKHVFCLISCRQKPA